MSIRVKETFKNQIAFDPTKESVTMTIATICQNVKENKIVLPIFQTGLRWTIAKVVDLLNFQLTGFAPVSPISMCKLDFGYVEDKKVINRLGQQLSLLDREYLDNLRGEVYSLTDGQQRVSTNYKCYIGHDDYQKIVLDLSKGKFLNLKDGLFPTEAQIPVGILYNQDMQVFIQYLEKHSELSDYRIGNYINIIRNKFLGYNYTINFAKNLSEKEQFRWFEILNNAGSKIPLKEMNLSRLKTKDIDYHKEFIDPFMDLIEEYEYEGYFPTEATKVTYPLSSLNPAYDYLFATERANNMAPIPSDVKEKKLCALETAQLKDLFSKTLDALQKVLIFVEENGLEKYLRNRLEYITFAIGYYIFNDNQLSDKKKENLIQWFKDTNFVNMPNTEKRTVYQKLITM